MHVKSMLVVASLVAATALMASPAVAKTHHRVTCKQIKDALAGGKSEDEVAKDLKVSASTVKHCSAQTTAAASKSHTHAK